MRLYLCEKPSQGKDIARVLDATKRGEGCYSGAGLAVTWCIGHLLETTPPGGSRAGGALVRCVNPQAPRGGLRAAASFVRAPAHPRFPAAPAAQGWYS
jgi:DNA topoisomerase IA